MRRLPRLLARLVATVSGLVAVDVGVALAKDRLHPTTRVVDRASGRAVVESRELFEKIQMTATWASMTGSRVLCRTPVFLRYLEQMTMAAGETMDHPDSRQRITRFIDDNAVDPTTIDRPLSEFATLNEFFARQLPDGARPIASPTDPLVMVSPADCRISCHPSVALDTDIEIKARHLQVERMLGLADRSARQPDAHEAIARFADRHRDRGLAIAVCRLAPGDYHRFHSPVDATWSPELVLDTGEELHSVAPIVVQSPVDVFGRNRRKVSIQHSPDLGEFAVVIVGAVKVASIELTAAMPTVRRGDEFGVFRYGGSTVVLLCDPTKVTFDPDLVATTASGAETRIRMGESIGTIGPTAVAPPR